MQDVRKDLRYLLESTLKPDTKDHESIVDRFYAPNAILIHPAFTVEGKDKIATVLKTWTGSNRKLTPTIHDIIYDPDRQVAFCDFTEHFTHKLMPWMTFDFRVQTKFYLRGMEGGMKIVKQEDTFPLQGMIRAHWITQMIYDNMYLPMSSKCTDMMIGMMSGTTPTMRGQSTM